MSFIKNYVHCVWTTKRRIPYFKDAEKRKEIWKHIFTNGKNKDIHIDVINGYEDHCHCLISINAQQCIADVVKLLKGESSHWINRNKLTSIKFEWQSNYYASGVSDERLSGNTFLIRKIITREFHSTRSWRTFWPANSFRAKAQKGGGLLPRDESRGN